MKKQIFILTMMMLAFLFAGVKSYGQTITVHGDIDCKDIVKPLTCASDDDALHPLPGKTYHYGVSNAANDVKSIHWFAYNAKDPNQELFTGGYEFNDMEGKALPFPGAFIASTDGAIYNKEVEVHTAADLRIDIAWQYFDPSNVILLVAYVKGKECADNIEVYRIQPAFSFTLDIVGLMPDGKLPQTGNANDCVSPIQSAEYDGTNLIVDYGENYVYFLVAAANFTHSWKPTITAAHDGIPSSVIDEIAWAYRDDAANTTEWNVVSNNEQGDDPVEAPDNATVGEEGQCIVVRVHVVHGNVENDELSTITVGIDGIMYDAAEEGANKWENDDLKDLDELESGVTCLNDVTDKAIFDLLPRPSIITDTEYNRGQGEDPELFEGKPGHTIPGNPTP